MIGPGLAAAASLILAATAAPAQDLPTTQLEDHAGVVRQDMLTRSLLRQRNRNATAAPTRQQRAACAGKRRFAASHGRGDHKVRQLYALCARIGL